MLNITFASSSAKAAQKLKSDIMKAYGSKCGHTCVISDADDEKVFTLSIGDEIKPKKNNKNYRIKISDVKEV